MDAKELRIGNWIMLLGVDYQHDNKFPDPEGDEPIQVNVDVLKEVERSEADYGPIPLTVELMDKIEGWERLPQDNGPIVYRKKLSPVGKYLVVSVGGEIVTVLEEYMEAMGQPVGKRHMILLPFHAKALHQLQNLFYCLTGQELEIHL